jgi:hypothetical protein
MIPKIHNPLPRISEKHELYDDLKAVLNKHGVDGITNTADFILAKMVIDQLEAYALARNEQLKWETS